MIGKLKLWGGLVFAAIAAFFAYGQHKKAEAKREIRAKQNEEALERSRQAREIERNVDALTSDDVRNQLGNRLRENRR